MKLLIAVWSFIKGRLSGMPVIVAKTKFGGKTNLEIKLLKLFMFKSDTVKDEFASDKLDYRLKVILYALAGFIYWHYGKSLTITELYRTQEMQDEYYKDDPIYQQKKWLSTHQMWRAADLSTYYFTEFEITGIKDFLDHFEYGDGAHNTYLIHNIGLGSHLHLQISSLEKTAVKK